MMKHFTRTTFAVALLGASFALAQESTGPSAQEPGTKQEDPPKEQEDPKKQEEDDETDLRDLNPFTPPGGGAGGAEELEELFLTVEKRLQRVTDLLYEASSGDTSGADGIGGAGIDELIREAESGASSARSDMARMLEATRGQSEATLDDIQRILELAQQQQSSSSSGGGQSQSQPGDMPQQGQTPSGSRKEETGERPPRPQQGDQQQEQSQDPQGEEPKGNQETEGGPDGPAKNPPGSETGDPSGAAGNEDWGDLPIHLRKVFQNGVSDDVPPRYRDWVDSYYKRLNRRSGR